MQVFDIKTPDIFLNCTIIKNETAAFRQSIKDNATYVNNKIRHEMGYILSTNRPLKSW